MTSDYALLGILLGLILLTWWVSEKAAQLRDARNKMRLAPRMRDIRGKTVVELKRDAWK